MAFAISIFSFTLAFYAVHAVKLGTSNLLESDEARLQIFPRRMLTERNGRSARRGIEKPALRAPKKASQLSSTLSNSCGLGKRILHAIPDLAWNFYAISVRPGHERNLMTPDFAAYSSDRITEGEDRFWVPSSGPGLEFSGFGEIMCPERYN